MSRPNPLIFLSFVLGIALITSAATTAYVTTHTYRFTVTSASNTTKATDQSSIDTTGFQAVFLGNSQVYFGHLSVQSNGDYELTDIYYLGNNATTLTKLGSESHQPKDAMFIPKTSVEFWENLQHANQFNGQLR